MLHFLATWSGHDVKCLAKYDHKKLQEFGTFIYSLKDFNLNQRESPENGKETTLSVQANCGRYSYLMKSNELLKAVDETEKTIQEKPATDMMLSLKTELLSTSKAEVQSSVGAAKREVLGKTVEKSLRDTFQHRY